MIGARRYPEGSTASASRGIAFVVASVVAALALAASSAADHAKAAAPPMSRHEIIARAESAVGSAYTWGRESWTPNTAGPGPDCSGLVLKCWEVPRTLLYQEEDGVNGSISPRYTVSYFVKNLGPWTSLANRSQLLAGDTLAYVSGSSGHIVIYAEGDAWNYPIVYEAPYTGANVRRASRYLSSAYQPRRRNGLTDASILLDNPTAQTTGGKDTGGNWTRSTNCPGFYGHNYQVQRGTSSSAWARWTPRIPASGYYNVYVRWASASDRASNARMSVVNPTSTATRYLDQRSGGGAWYKLGRYYFNAGYSPSKGSVILYATGANGYVVADAVLFAPTK
jgi:cell wall-associated NlpC family hydrolase